MTCVSLYIHVPFCIHRCGYCDFNTYAGLQGLIPAYSQAVCRELEFVSAYRVEKYPIHTVYFGGGTPSLLYPELLAGILRIIKEKFDLSPSAEISLEANPGTLSLEYLAQIRKLGVNRLSLGMQSAQPHELRLLERQHSYEDVIQAVGWARKAGFENLNLDLIFGLPNQELSSWQASLEAALALQPDHLSLYSLTLEHGTPLQHQVSNGTLPLPDTDLAADMYEIGRERLKHAGFAHYEISNWAKDGDNGEVYLCKHNLQYWYTLPYIGIGAGAHSFIDHYRSVNISSPKAYIKRINHTRGWISARDQTFRSPAIVETSFIDREEEMGEAMMMGLRLVQVGVSNQEFTKRYGISLQDKFGPQINRLVTSGLLEWVGPLADQLRLTMRGQLLGNRVFCEFI
jgi:oxygen-independent coproporphyrinogen-3 oxidase